MQYPAGHLSHLSENQQAQLVEFKAICEKAGYYTPAVGQKHASHDDETLLCVQNSSTSPTKLVGKLTRNRRYLRARRFVPQEAFKQFKDTEDWRKENKLSDIFNTIDVEEYEQTRRLVPIPRPTMCSFSLTSSPSIRNGWADVTSAAFPSSSSKSPRSTPKISLHTKSNSQSQRPPFPTSQPRICASSPSMNPSQGSTRHCAPWCLVPTRRPPFHRVTTLWISVMLV